MKKFISRHIVKNKSVYLLNKKKNISSYIKKKYKKLIAK